MSGSEESAGVDAGDDGTVLRGLDIPGFFRVTGALPSWEGVGVGRLDGSNL